MKHLYFLLLATFVISAKAQTKKQIDSLAGFDMIHFNEHLSEMKDSKSKIEFTEKIKRDFIKSKYALYPSTTFTSAKTSTSSCSNLDFEDGNLGGWTVTGDFQLMSGSGLDPYGLFPVVCPGGNYSLRLNDDNIVGKTSFKSTATQTILISSTNAIIKVNFAGALLNFPHPSNAAGLFKVEFFDQFNNVIPTQTISVYYSNPPGALTPTTVTSFSSSTSGKNIGNQTYPVTYIPWQSQSFNLTSYIGQNVSIKLSANWCIYNYDWMYAYFDVCCSSACPDPPFTASGNYCVSLPYSMCAPAGQQSYLWSNSSGPIGTTSCITVNSSGTYSLTYFAPSLSTTVNNSYIFNAPPIVSFSLANLFCLSSAIPITLSGSPSGGVFSGPGMSGNIFYPGSANIGLNTITYQFKDTATGCTSIATQTTNVSYCTGINYLSQNNQIQVYPSPFQNQIIINGNLPVTNEFVLFNSEGKEIIRKKLSVKTNAVQVADLPSGIYFYTLSDENQVIKKGKLVRE
jgi:hypothetical protein